jgi:hypothetical protein
MLLLFIYIIFIFRIFKLYFKYTLRIRVSVFLADHGIVVSPYLHSVSVILSPSQLSKYIQQIMMSHNIINKIQLVMCSEKQKQTPQKVKLVKFNTGSIRCNTN